VVGIIRVIRTKSFEKPLLYRRLPIIAFLSLINLPIFSFEVEFEEFIMGARNMQADPTGVYT
jgi:hypothetical protein